MTFEIEAKDVDVEAIMSAIRQRIAEKKNGLYTEEEIREIAERRLEVVQGAQDVSSALLADFGGSRSAGTSRSRRRRSTAAAGAPWGRSSRPFAGP